MRAAGHDRSRLVRVDRGERAAYAVAAVVTSLAGALGRRRTHAVSKAALMPLLQVGLVRDRRQFSPQGLGALLGATGAAWVGDLVLIAPEGGESDEASRRRLRKGAAAFAVQQLIYAGLLVQAGARPRPRSTAVVAGTLLGLAALDTAKESKPDPVVTAYGVLLGTTGALALGMPRSAGDLAIGRIPWGGASFVASDAMILLGEQVLTGRAAQAGHGFVLATYALAQRWLVDGLATTLVE